MIKYYKIPEWHDLHAKYYNYLKNREKTKQMVIWFMKKHDLRSGLIQVKEEIKLKKRNKVQEEVVCQCFMISDKDPNILKRDVEKLGVSLTRPTKDNFYPLRINSPIYHDWVDMLKKNDNFKILDIPCVKEYVIIDNKKEKKDVGTFNKLFVNKDDDLYLRIESKNNFIANEDFIEITEKQASLYFTKEQMEKNKSNRQKNKGY